MRWLQVGGVVVSVMATTGCPSEFGKDGRVAKAIHQDTKEQIIIIKQCSTKRRKEVCAHGQENSFACLECGGPP